MDGIEVEWIYAKDDTRGVERKATVPTFGVLGYDVNSGYIKTDGKPLVEIVNQQTLGGIPLGTGLRAFIDLKKGAAVCGFAVKAIFTAGKTKNERFAARKAAEVFCKQDMNNYTHCGGKHNIVEAAGNYFMVYDELQSTAYYLNGSSKDVGVANCRISRGKGLRILKQGAESSMWILPVMTSKDIKKNTPLLLSYGRMYGTKDCGEASNTASVTTEEFSHEMNGRQCFIGEGGRFVSANGKRKLITKISNKRGSQMKKRSRRTGRFMKTTNE